MNDLDKLGKKLVRQYIGCIFDSYKNKRDCGYPRPTKFFIKIIEVKDDFDIDYGFHFDSDMNFLGYGYLPPKTPRIVPHTRQVLTRSPPIKP